MDSTSAYIYGDGLAPVEQVNLSTGVITYLVHDSLGSVRGAVASSGSLIGTTSYDAWGNPLTTGGLTATTQFGYAGGYTDPTGLIYLINRYYNPQTGQFISVDPAIAQSNQPYTYAAGNPVSRVDPTGLLWGWVKDLIIGICAWVIPAVLVGVLDSVLPEAVAADEWVWAGMNCAGWTIGDLIIAGIEGTRFSWGWAGQLVVGCLLAAAVGKYVRVIQRITDWIVETVSGGLSDAYYWIDRACEISTWFGRTWICG